MLLDSVKRVAEDEEPGIECLSITWKHKNKTEELKFQRGSTSGATSSQVLLVKEKYNISGEKCDIVGHYLYMYLPVACMYATFIFFYCVGYICMYLCTYYCMHIHIYLLYICNTIYYNAFTILYSFCRRWVPGAMQAE